MYEDGRLYEGTLENSVRQGKGLFVKGNRQWYYGEYANDRKDGEGLEVGRHYNYEGGYTNGVRHGAGKLIAKGLTFSGEWRMGIIHGYGVLKT